MRTVQLIDKAEATGKPLADYARTLGLKPNTLAQAKHTGRLSAAIAVALAAELGDKHPERWALAAIQENERSEPMRKRIAAIAAGFS